MSGSIIPLVMWSDKCHSVLFVLFSWCSTGTLITEIIIILMLSTFPLILSLTSTLDPQEALVMDLLCQLLVDGQASPFYQSLIESGIGSNFSPGTG